MIDPAVANYWWSVQRTMIKLRQSALDYGMQDLGAVYWWSALRIDGEFVSYDVLKGLGK